MEIVDIQTRNDTTRPSERLDAIIATTPDGVTQLGDVYITGDQIETPEWSAEIDRTDWSFTLEGTQPNDANVNKALAGMPNGEATYSDLHKAMRLQQIPDDTKTVDAVRDIVGTALAAPITSTSHTTDHNPVLSYMAVAATTLGFIACIYLSPVHPILLLIAFIVLQAVLVYQTSSTEEISWGTIGVKIETGSNQHEFKVGVSSETEIDALAKKIWDIQQKHRK